MSFLTAQYASDITRTLNALNRAERAMMEYPKTVHGQGDHAIIRQPIPVYADYTDAKYGNELEDLPILGHYTYSDYAQAWHFTMNDEEK